MSPSVIVFSFYLSVLGTQASIYAATQGTEAVSTFSVAELLRSYD